MIVVIVNAVSRVNFTFCKICVVGQLWSEEWKYFSALLLGSILHFVKDIFPLRKRIRRLKKTVSKDLIHFILFSAFCHPISYCFLKLFLNHLLQMSNLFKWFWLAWVIYILFSPYSNFSKSILIVKLWSTKALYGEKVRSWQDELWADKVRGVHSMYYIAPGSGGFTVIRPLPRLFQINKIQILHCFVYMQECTLLWGGRGGWRSGGGSC